MKREEKKKIKLYSQETGDSVGEVDILVTSMKARKAANIKEDSIYQYQRWQPGIGWGSTFPGHFLPTDPNVGDNSYGWSTTSSGADRSSVTLMTLLPMFRLTGKYMFLGVHLAIQMM